jgi:hypothetical protein
MAIPIPNGDEPIHDGDETMRLAVSEGIGSVTLCGCGTLSLNVQALSLRLDMKAFAQLYLMCSEAMERLEHIARDEANDAHLLSELKQHPTLVH